MYHFSSTLAWELLWPLPKLLNIQLFIIVPIVATLYCKNEKEQELVYVDHEKSNLKNFNKTQLIK